MKSEKQIKYILVFILIQCLTAPSFAQSCKFVSERFQNKLQQKFKQNPVQLVETFANSSHKLLLNDIDKRETAEIQNKMLIPSFDIATINKALLKNLKTKFATRYLMDWVRTQYWGNIYQLYFTKEKALKYIAKDLINPEETKITKENPVFTKALKVTKRRCSLKEKDLNLCTKSLYEVHVQFSPFISCRQEDLKKSFQGKYILNYTKNQGFKIIDIELSGKRLLLSSVDYLSMLHRKGLNATALGNQLKLLSSHAGSFVPPGVVPHSNNFLARFGQQSPRTPASL